MFEENLTKFDFDVAQDSLKIYIDKALKLRFKSLCALQDRDMSQVAVELIEQWIKQQEDLQGDRS